MLGSLPRNNPTFFWAFWFRAKNRTTGAVQPGGLWTGATERTFTIRGEARAYAPGGAIIGMDNLAYLAGVENIQSQNVRLNGVSNLVEELTRTYDPKQGEFEIHRVRPANPNSLSGAWVIEQAFAGRIDNIRFRREAADEKTGAIDEIVTLNLMSASRMGTRTLSLKKSDASQRLTNTADGGRKYSASKAKVSWMGEVKNPHKVRVGRGDVRA